MAEITSIVERRKQLQDLAKTRDLSVAEKMELRVTVQKELVHDFATGEIGGLGLILLFWLTCFNPPLSQ